MIKLTSIMARLMGLAFIVAQFVAGFQGIHHYLGLTCAIISILLAGFFGITLPIVIGSFFGAYAVWHWHWLFALIFMLPGWFLIVPLVPLIGLISFGKAIKKSLR